MSEQERDQQGPGEASELEGGGTEQTWGQGTGAHEPTIGDENEAAASESEETTSYAGGTATDLDDPGIPLNREEEGTEL